jgi:membrane protein
MAASDHSGMGRQLRRGFEAGKKRYSGSSADALWRRLNSVDFLNQGMVFAGTLLLCALPFFIVTDALTGQSTARGLGRRLGLDRQAAGDVGHLFISSHATVASVTGVAWVFLVLSGYAVAASLQGLYQRVFDLNGRVTRDAPRALLWLVLLVGWLYASAFVGPPVRASGPVVFGTVGLVVFTLFWWFTMWILLAGRIPWRRLVPCAVATGVFWLSMEAFFAVTFSGTVTSDDREYGQIGTVFALMSYLIAIGVVVILGAVTGLVWQERGMSFRAPFRKLRPKDQDPVSR